MKVYSMTKKTLSSVWYGGLRSKRSNTIVIRDNKLLPAAQCRIYLYNTEREALVQYDEMIVSDKLFELDYKQQKQVEKQFKSGWEAAKKKLSTDNEKSSSPPKVLTKYKPVDYLQDDDDHDFYED
jgi:hypothetical protein